MVAVSDFEISLWQVFTTTLTLCGLYVIVKGYQARTFVRGHPTPPHHWFWGHLITMGEAISKMPQDCHPHLFLTQLNRIYNFKEYYALDNWPVPSGSKTIVVTDPTIAAQVIAGNFPKHPSVRGHVVHIIGEKSLVTLEGQEWKRIRQLFNPGFSLNNLFTLIDGIVDDCVVFADVLSRFADNGKTFALEELGTRLTFDIIGRVALDISLNTQTSDNELVNAFRDSVMWSPYTGMANILTHLDIRRPFATRYHTYRMEKYLNRVLDERLLSGQEDFSKPKVKMSVIDSALQEFISNEATSSNLSSAEKKAFRRYAIDSMKTFMFAGHDTSSSAIAFVFYLLARTPTALTRVRKEHDEVFGTDLAAVPDLIKSDPHLLNKLHYTLAVIKETLRIFSPASTVRIGGKGATLTRSDGTVVSVEGYMVWPPAALIHRREDLFPAPDEFHPERFLSASDLPPPSERIQDSIPSGAWRPFERGPRACIGQELALLEIKLAIVLAVRTFDFEPVYDEFWAKGGMDKVEGLQSRPNPGKYKSLWGFDAYQVFVATAKPAGGMPVRVRRREM